jgi:hydroxyacylglutathione hydrolase
MTTAVRRTLTAAGIVFVTVAVLFTFMGIKFKSETSIMTPVPTGMVADGVYAAKDSFINVYFVKGDGGYVAFDAGNDAENLRHEMKKLEIEPSMVRAVFLTHTDNDHVAGLKVFIGAKVYIAKQEEQMINGSRRRMFVFKNKSIPAYETMADGQDVNIAGISVRGVLTPGHTPGSMCYLVKGRQLFTGDTLSLKNGSVELFNDFFNMDSAMERTSFAKISSLPGVTHIFTAHYGFTGDYARAFGKWNK